MGPVVAYKITHNEGDEGDILDADVSFRDLYEAEVEIRSFETPEEAIAWVNEEDE